MSAIDESRESAAGEEAAGEEAVSRASSRRFSVGRVGSSLRYRNYRLYFFGQLVSVMGTWMQTVAQSFLVLDLTHSGTDLGLVALLISSDHERSNAAFDDSSSISPRQSFSRSSRCLFQL